MLWNCKSLNFVKKNYRVTTLDLKIWWDFEHKILVETTAFIFFINIALDLWFVFVIKYFKYFMAVYDACLQCFYNFSWDLFCILSWTFLHILFLAIWLTTSCNLPPPLPISTDLRQQTKILQLYIYLTACIASVCSGLTWCTFEISNVLLGGGLHNHLFFIAALACIQNNNISGLLNPKHVRI